MNNYIDINIRELIDNCSEDDRFLDNMDALKDLYNKKIHNLTSYTPFNIFHFMHNIRLYEDGSLTFEENDLLDVLGRIFGIKSRNFNEEDLIRFINTNIKFLKGIRSEDELYNYFPKLYEMYKYGKGMYNEFFRMHYLDLKYESNQKEYERQDKIRKKYYSYGFRDNCTKFCNVQADYFERLIRHKDDIKKICNKKDYIDASSLDGLNKDKFELYVIYKCLDKIENCNDDLLRNDLLKDVKIKLINAHGMSNKIKIFDNIDFNSLYAKYIKISRKYSIPRIIEVNSSILPNSKDNSKRGKKREGTYKPLSEEERLELIEINRRKKEFYENSGYLTVIREKENLTGNSAYVYPNGQILEDYIADEEVDSSLRNNKKNAIYHVDIYSFEDLLGIGKLEVKRDSRCHGTINHVGDWESRTKKIVEIAATKEVVNDTKEFILKLKQK